MVLFCFINFDFCLKLQLWSGPNVHARHRSYLQWLCLACYALHKRFILVCILLFLFSENSYKIRESRRLKHWRPRILYFQSSLHKKEISSTFQDLDNLSLSPQNSWNKFQIVSRKIHESYTYSGAISYKIWPHFAVFVWSSCIRCTQWHIHLLCWKHRKSYKIPDHSSLYHISM